MSATKIPSCPLPTGASVRKLGVIGQSNAVGPVQTFARTAQLTVPHYYRSMTLHNGVPGYWERNGSLFGDQFYPQSKFKGPQEQAGIDMLAAGKAPILATIAKSGTSIVEFQNGSQTNIDFLRYMAEIAASGVGTAGWNFLIFWGEADALTLATSLAWQANLTALAATVRTFFPGARFYVCQLNAAYVGNDVTWNANVRTGNTNFVAGDVNAELLNLDAFGYVSPHYNDPGQNSVGSLYTSRVLVYQP